MNDEKINKLGSLNKEQLKALLKKRASMGLVNKDTLERMPRNDSGEYPLSNSQERFWFLEQLNHGTALYNNPVYALTEVDKAINPIVMEKALGEIVNRHEILRTSIHYHQGSLFQKVHKSISFKLNYEDICALSKSDQEVYMKETALREVSKNFKLDQAPLWRFRILKVSSNTQLFLFTPHHIISDGWSNSIFLQELVAAYSSMLKVGYANLKEKPYQFIDYVGWEQKWFKSSDYEKSLKYWNKALSPVSPDLRLPIDYNRPPIISGKGKMINLLLSKKETDNIHQYTKSRNITSFHTLFTALSILLHRYSQQNEVVIGVPVANRNKSEFQNIVGLFLNTIPFKTNINSPLSFNEIVMDVKAQTESNLMHQHMPFDKIVSSLDIEQRLDITPLFQVLFVFQNIKSLYSVGGAKIKPYKVDIGYTKNDLNFWIELFDDAYLITLFANTDIFSAQKIERILQHYKTIIAKLIEYPDTPISEIDFLLPEEKQIIDHNPIVNKINDNFKDRFESILSSCGSRYAVEFKNKKITFDELNSKANQMANLLVNNNQSHEPVAILLNRGIHMIVSLLAVIKSGVPYVPIDPNQPSSRINYILSDCHADIIISESQHELKFSNATVKSILIDNDDAEIKNYSSNSPQINISANDYIYIIYTSGTTGNPKGVCIPHSALLNYTDSIISRIGFTPNSTYATVSTIAADLGNTMIFPALLNSGKILVTPDDALQSPNILASYFTNSPPDYLKIVPSHLNALLVSDENVLPKKALVLGGEELNINLLDKIRKLSTQLDVYNHYGPTESTIGVTTYKILNDENEIPIGKPLNSCQVYILDNHMKPLPLGVVGEIYIGGLSLASKYLNNKGLTKELFVENPFYVGEKLYKTNDKGLLRDDGNIIFKGRYDRQIKYNGHRIELKEIEVQIENIEEIEQAIILKPCQDTYTQLWAVVSLRTHTNETIIKDKLASNLPNYMIPSKIFILEEIPVTLNGKIDYKQVTTLVRSSFKKESITNEEVELTETEKQLSDIFSEILNIKNPNINQSFYDMGGSSISSIGLLHSINKQFNSDLSLAFLFNFSTIKKIANEIHNKFTFSHIVKFNKGSIKKSLFLVHPAGGNITCYHSMASLFEKDMGVYGVQTGTEEITDGNVKTMAGIYLDELYELKLPDELIFGGWSMGALIAYEMAAQYHKKTGKLSRVLIIDQMAYQKNYKSNKIDDIQKVVLFAKKVEQLVGDRLNIQYEDLVELSKSDRSLIFLNKFKQYGLAPKNIELDDFDGFLEQMLHHNEISANNVPSKYKGNVIVIRAENPLVLDDDDTTYGINRPEDLLWGEFAKHIKIITSPGNHASIMRSPNIEIMTKKLNNVILQ